uniref:GTP cyclohydrolase 1 feedback regulatory protein n=2 Tax=Estrildinae TaxID=40155 RepID=H0Z8D6_TAEGU|nr:GTP cyclohydrolase 1 feedback regulatory protein [Taeniopygia guttata]
MKGFKSPMFSDNNPTASRKTVFSQKILVMLNILLQGNVWSDCRVGLGMLCRAHLPGSTISQSSPPCCYFLLLYLPAINFRFLRLPYPSSPCSLPPRSSAPCPTSPCPPRPCISSPGPSSPSSSSPGPSSPCSSLSVPSCPSLGGTAAPRSRGIRRSPPGAFSPPLPGAVVAGRDRGRPRARSPRSGGGSGGAEMPYLLISTQIRLEAGPTMVGDEHSDPHLMSILGATKRTTLGNNFCEYYVNDAPRMVLDKLESLGYRVVSMTGVGQTLVWCLHRE